MIWYSGLKPVLGPSVWFAQKSSAQSTQLADTTSIATLIKIWVRNVDFVTPCTKMTKLWPSIWESNTGWSKDRLLSSKLVPNFVDLNQEILLNQGSASWGPISILTCPICSSIWLCIQTSSNMRMLKNYRIMIVTRETCPSLLLTLI